MAKFISVQRDITLLPDAQYHLRPAKHSLFLVKWPPGNCFDKIRVTSLSGCITKILTLHRMSKMDFEPDFRNPQMLSFLNMCNTMGSKMDGLAVREHFLSKNAEKTAF